jgi:hypothetical protein
VARKPWGALEDLIKAGEAARMLSASPDTIANYCRQSLLMEYRTPGDGAQSISGTRRFTIYHF